MTGSWQATNNDLTAHKHQKSAISRKRQTSSRQKEKCKWKIKREPFASNAPGGLRIAVGSTAGINEPLTDRFQCVTMHVL